VLRKPPALLAGGLRRAGEVDLGLLQRWAHAFVVEIGLVDEIAGIAEAVERAH